MLLCTALSAGLLAGPAHARPRDAERPRVERQDLRSERRDDGAADAARLAQKRNGGGRVLSVEPTVNGHRVKVLKDGVVRVYVIEDK